MGHAPTGMYLRQVDCQRGKKKNDLVGPRRDAAFGEIHVDSTQSGATLPKQSRAAAVATANTANKHGAYQRRVHFLFSSSFFLLSQKLYGRQCHASKRASISGEAMPIMSETVW